MNDTEDDNGFASRLLHSAKDMIWQADPMDRSRAPSLPSAKPINNKTEAVANTISPVANGMSADLLAVVMNRPTAYSALSEAIAALAEIPMDEATRYRSAFAVLKKTQQRTVEQITQAIEVHVGVLEAEIIRFQGQSKNQEDGEITARITEVAAINASLDQSKQQIARLRTETDARIAQLQEDLNKKQLRAKELAQETEQKKLAILQTTHNFETAITTVKEILNREKTKLLQYLV